MSSSKDSILSDADLRALLQIAAASDLEELQVEREDLRVVIRRDSDGAGRLPAAAADAQAVDQGVIDTTRVVSAPWVGVFQCGVRVGDQIHPGQVVGTVDALRMRHNVEADAAGLVEVVLVEDGHAVEYSQALIRLRTDGVGSI